MPVDNHCVQDRMSASTLTSLTSLRSQKKHDHTPVDPGLATQVSSTGVVQVTECPLADAQELQISCQSGPSRSRISGQAGIRSIEHRFQPDRKYNIDQWSDQKGRSVAHPGS